MATDNKMYYNEEEAQRLIKEYIKTVVIQDKCVIAKNVKVEEEIMLMVKKIVIAIINNYRYYIFEDYEDLIQEGMRACYIGLPRYKKEKGTSFNYFSLIAKIHLLNYTQRKQRHRVVGDIDDHQDIETNDQMNLPIFIKSFICSAENIINESFVREKRKQYLKITYAIMDYINKSQRFVKKTDMYAWCRSYGIKSQSVREYIKDLGGGVQACWES